MTLTRLTLFVRLEFDLRQEEAGEDLLSRVHVVVRLEVQHRLGLEKNEHILVG